TVFYPNTSSDVKIIAGSSDNNLTYSVCLNGNFTCSGSSELKPAMFNMGLQARDVGPNHFVLLLSKRPRPLSDFLPDAYRGAFVDWQSKRIEPWQIGPGYFDRGS